MANPFKVGDVVKLKEGKMPFKLLYNLKLIDIFNNENQGGATLEEFNKVLSSTFKVSIIEGHFSYICLSDKSHKKFNVKYFEKVETPLPETPKFKIGDKVRVKDIKPGVLHNDVSFNLEMSQCCGKIFTLTHSVVENCFCLVEQHQYHFHKDWLELAEITDVKQNIPAEPLKDNKAPLPETPKFKIGDKVRVKNVEVRTGYVRGSSSFMPEMVKFCGKVFEIARQVSQHNFHLKEAAYFWFHEDWLELVEEKIPKENKPEDDKGVRVQVSLDETLKLLKETFKLDGKDFSYEIVDVKEKPKENQRKLKIGDNVKIKNIEVGNYPCGTFSLATAQFIGKICKIVQESFMKDCFLLQSSDKEVKVYGYYFHKSWLELVEDVIKVPEATPVSSLQKRKFKVGDKVRVKDIKYGRQNGGFFALEMVKLIGKVFEVEIDEFSVNHFRIKGKNYYFYEDWLELVEESKENKEKQSPPTFNSLCSNSSGIENDVTPVSLSSRPELKIGDKVRIKNIEAVIYDCGTFSSDMEKLISKVGKIVKKSSVKDCFLLESSDKEVKMYGYYFHKSWLELVEDVIKIPDEATPISPLSPQQEKALDKIINEVETLNKPKRKTITFDIPIIPIVFIIFFLISIFLIPSLCVMSLAR